MDEYITVSAKTLDDAITDALVELGVTSDQLDYIVVEKGSAGFLGIGMKQAVIKARRKQADPEPEEKKEEEIQPEEQTAKKEIKKDIRRPEKKKQKKSSHSDKNHREPAEHQEEPEDRNEEKVELVPVEEITIETCKKFIQDVMEAMHMENVEVTAEVDKEGALSINIDGKNMGILIGKRGQTLDSLQYLTNRVANKMQSGYVRVKLDTEDYRRRRKETLENLAKNIASKVKRTRRTVALEPMNPYERRIIHSALQSDPAVSTHSEGEEPYRRVVVTLVRR